ncbi:MAG: hypothetical protein RMJ98_21725 [Myxococcales bacterium]|nr:hypothetical protein [Polyangiaceae bacterium]MDW8251924.1 hypothetical protein [Myxococcales bacterium]
MSGILPRCHVFRIARRRGCSRSLSWTLYWRGFSPEAGHLAQALSSHGFSPLPSVPGLFYAEDPLTHEQVLLVLRTCRVELRIPYVIPPRDRSQAAVRLAHRVAQIAQTIPPFHHAP